MKTFRTTLLGLLLVSAAMASAQTTPVTVVDAVELAPSNINLPATLGGTMSFQPCDDACSEPYVRVKLSPETVFTVNGKRMRFQDFRQEFALARQSANGYALVLYNVRTNTATEIEVLN